MQRYRDERGQSMVEFAMMFIVFFIFIFACLSIILWGYNFNMLQRAGYEASRQYAIGNAQDVPVISNWEGGTRRVGYNREMAKMTLQSQMAQKLIPLPLFHFSVGNIRYALMRLRNPDPNYNAYEQEYTDGNTARISMDYRFGISLGYFGALYATYELNHDMVIVRGNDEDRDGRDDTYEGRYANDHNNNLVPDGDTDWVDDLDDDTDGVLDYWDTGIIIRNSDGSVELLTNSWVDTPHTTDTLTFGTANQYGAGRVTIMDNLFHLPLWSNSMEFPNLIFPYSVPDNGKNPDGTWKRVAIEVSLKYDWDNDGWQDCYELSPHYRVVH